MMRYYEEMTSAIEVQTRQVGKISANEISPSNNLRIPNSFYRVQQVSTRKQFKQPTKRGITWSLLANTQE